MPSQRIQVSKSSTVAVVTLNQPDRLNAWSRGMRDELAAVLRNLNSDDSVKAVVFTGAGDRAFCAGQDFTESQHFAGHDDGHVWLGEIKAFYDLIRKTEKPTVAALNGIAAGSGFQVALMLDFRIGHSGVRMGQPELNNGIPSVVGPWVMSNRIGMLHTIDLALTGRLVDADEALRMGMLNRIVKPEEVLPVSIALAQELGAKPPLALMYTKRAFRQSTEADFNFAFEIAEEAQTSAFASGEPQRCMEEFLRVRAARKQAAAVQA